MLTVEEIEAAIRSLPADDKFGLAKHIQDLLWEARERQIEEDGASGRFDHIISEVEADIAAGRTKPLDELLDNF